MNGYESSQSPEIHPDVRAAMQNAIRAQEISTAEMLSNTDNPDLQALADSLLKGNQ